MMKPWKIVAAILLAAGGFGCAAGGGPDTGLEGRIMKGPMCPGPGRIDRPCPDRPAEGVFLLLRPDGSEAARFRTDAEGKFKAAAPPGIYFVVPFLGKDEGFLAGRREVVVPADGWGRVELTFDTGMR